MALKDWKKISNFTYITRYNNEKNHRGLVIALDHPTIKDWIVYGTFLNKKRFKNKSAALRFAKSYMKSH